jgi:type IV pilus assembly protein PilW
MKNNNYKNQGFSLVELMVGVAIGLIILTGLITVFDTVSKMNRTQNGLARLQENGRYAVTLIKQELEQSGYQYCIGSSLTETNLNDPVYPQPWVVFSPGVTSGLPTRVNVSQVPATTTTQPYLLDTAYFLHGHDCNGSSCSPSLTSLGSATGFTIPDVGKNDGDRIANTDVLTFRYLTGAGRSLNRVSTNAATGVVNFVFTPDGSTPVAPSTDNSRVVVANCAGPAVVLDLSTMGSAVATANIPADPNRVINLTAQSLPRMFDLNTSSREISYYVANAVVDGRDIPTLYSVINGVSNAVIQGVDRFDVLYSVRTRDGNVLILDAEDVENLPIAQCVPTNRVVGIDLVDTLGCGWRSVVSLEVHLLLNTIYNSSTTAIDQFAYSIDGSGFQSPSNSSTEIDHYKMHRREFITTVTLKNY